MRVIRLTTLVRFHDKVSNAYGEMKETDAKKVEKMSGQLRKDVVRI